MHHVHTPVREPIRLRHVRELKADVRERVSRRDGRCGQEGCQDWGRRDAGRVGCEGQARMSIAWKEDKNQ